MLPTNTLLLLPLWLCCPRPRLPQKELREYCQAEGIAVEAYSSLGSGQLLKDAQVASVAAGVGRTPAAVLYRWALQHGCIILPKSVTQSRIVENAKLFDFELDEKAMAQLDGMGKDHHFSWNPYTIA